MAAISERIRVILEDPARRASREPTDLEGKAGAYDARIASVLTTAWHPGGTCKMGRDDLAGVDPELHVRGVDRLRVADAGYRLDS